MSTKTITLAGSEVKAEFSGANAWLRNDGADVIYAAAKPGITAGADGVVAIPAGQSAPVYGANGAVWLLGTGSVQLIGSDYSTNPFKVSAQAGGSGADEVARAAINTHSGNAEIHVTAAEKAAWSGKAELTDIPTTLPANGGNADTVGNRSVSGMNSLVRFTYQNADINTLISTGVYCGTFTNYPEEVRDGQGTLIVINYYTHNEEVSGTIGEGMLWLRQLFISAHGGQIYERTAVENDVSTWNAVNNGGNAASVGTYTEAKIAALEARIAALEGN